MMTYGAMASPNESGMLLEHRDARETLGKRRGGVVGASFNEMYFSLFFVIFRYFPQFVMRFFNCY